MAAVTKKRKKNEIHKKKPNRLFNGGVISLSALRVRGKRAAGEYRDSLYQRRALCCG